MYTLVLLHVLLAAQDTTATTDAPLFRRGQWAAQFQGGSSFGSLGFIKFRSPTRALVVDLRISGVHRESLNSDSTGTRFVGLESDAFTQLRLGWRRYQARPQSIITHFSFGLLAGFDHGVSANPGGSSSSNAWTAGIFGDVGGTYLLTRKFGIGALAGANISYTNSNTHLEPSGLRFRTWSISGSAITASLVATVFF